MTRESLIVAFYRPEGQNEPLVNRLTALITGQFSHVELLFRDPKTGKQNLASSIYQGENVFMRNKTFGRTYWTFKTIQITSNQADSMRTFCAAASQKEIPFNLAGLMRCCSPFPKPTDHLSYFCSEYAICAFQAAGLFLHVIPSVVTPSALFDMINDFNAHSTATPLLQERIQKKGLRFAFAGQNSVVEQKNTSKLKTSWTKFLER